MKSREPSPDRGGSDGDKEALSSWARYLKNKYGNRSTKDSTREGASNSTPSSSYSSSTVAPSSPASTSASTSASRRLSLGLPLRQANEMNHSSDDDSKNLQSSLASPTLAQAQVAGMEDTNTKFSTPRTQYLQKRRQILQIGGRGSESGKFTWPRGEFIAFRFNIWLVLTLWIVQEYLLAQTISLLSLIHQTIVFKFLTRPAVSSASLEHMGMAMESLTV